MAPLVLSLPLGGRMFINDIGLASHFLRNVLSTLVVPNHAAELVGKSQLSYPKPANMTSSMGTGYIKSNPCANLSPDHWLHSNKSHCDRQDAEDVMDSNRMSYPKPGKMTSSMDTGYIKSNPCADLSLS